MRGDAGDLPDVLAPAPNPCKSCPYRLDVPARVWHPDEYAKLPLYDRPTGEQPMAVFRCHQNNLDDPGARVCAGWAHTHGANNPPGHELMALRVAISAGLLTYEQAAAVDAYRTTVACFTSGTLAAHWGTTGPYTDASAKLAAGIIRRRPETARTRERRRRR